MGKIGTNTDSKPILHTERTALTLSILHIYSGTSTSLDNDY
jgi:hypothetical protein